MKKNKISTLERNKEEVEVTSDERWRQVTIKFNINRDNGGSQSITFMNHNNFIDFVRQMNIGLEILKQKHNYEK